MAKSNTSKNVHTSKGITDPEVTLVSLAAAQEVLQRHRSLYESQALVTIQASLQELKVIAANAVTGKELPGIDKRVDSNRAAARFEGQRTSESVKAASGSLVGAYRLNLPQNRPLPRLVGPGEFPTSDGLTSSISITIERTVGSDGMTRMTTTLRDDRGATFFVEQVTRETTSGRLMGWMTIEVYGDGRTRTTTHNVNYEGPNKDVPIVYSHTTVRGVQGETRHESSVSRRPHRADDPDITSAPPGNNSNQPVNPQDDSSGKGNSEPKPGKSQPAEDGTSVQRQRLPFGIECNPITGVCTPGMLLGNNQVNPGRSDDRGVVVSPRLDIDPQDLVTNPNPVDNLVKDKPRLIPREVGPGARPSEELPPGLNR